MALSEITNEMNVVQTTPSSDKITEKIYQSYTPKSTFGQVLAHSTPISSNNANTVVSRKYWSLIG